MARQGTRRLCDRHNLGCCCRCSNLNKFLPSAHGAIAAFIVINREHQQQQHRTYRNPLIGSRHHQRFALSLLLLSLFFLLPPESSRNAHDRARWCTPCCWQFAHVAPPSSFSLLLLFLVNSPLFPPPLSFPVLWSENSRSRTNKPTLARSLTFRFVQYTAPQPQCSWISATSSLTHPPTPPRLPFPPVIHKCICTHTHTLTNGAVRCGTVRCV